MSIKISLISKIITKEIYEIKNILKEECYIFTSAFDFEKKQEDFNAVYSLDPQELMAIKVKIPYFYDVSPKTFKDEMNFEYFKNYYSQISGPKAVFVSDKKLNKNANWWGLNSYWVNKSSDTDILCKRKKFLTPKLEIGYIYEGKEALEIIKNVIFAKKTNWVFHVYLPPGVTLETKDAIIYSGGLEKVKEDMLSKVHTFVTLDLLKDNTSERFPSEFGAEAMLHGCALISSNSHGNNTNILYDDLHYLKLDFLDTNTLINDLRYLDKRREKTEAISREGSKVIRKYFSYKEIALQKINIIKKYC